MKKIKKIYISFILVLFGCLSLFGIGLKVNADEAGTREITNLGQYSTTLQSNYYNCFYIQFNEAFITYSEHLNPNQIISLFNGKTSLNGTAYYLRLQLKYISANNYDVLIDGNTIYNGLSNTDKIAYIIEINRMEADIYIYNANNTLLYGNNFTTNIQITHCDIAKDFNINYCSVNNSAQIIPDLDLFVKAENNISVNYPFLDTSNTNMIYIKELRRNWTQWSGETNGFGLTLFTLSSSTTNYNIIFYPNYNRNNERSLPTNTTTARLIVFNDLTSQTLFSSDYDNRENIIIKYDPITGTCKISLVLPFYTFQSGLQYGYDETTIFTDRTITTLRGNVDECDITAFTDATDFTPAQITEQVLYNSSYFLINELVNNNANEYQRGYDEGYDEGFEWGETNNTMSPAFNVLANIFKVIGNIFAIELFPHIPLGVFIIIPLFFAGLGLILWIWRRN